jgi:hypothetical protein
VQVARHERDVIHGYRLLFGSRKQAMGGQLSGRTPAGFGAWRVDRASSSIEVAADPGGVAATVIGSSRLRIQATRPTRTLALEVPDVEPHAMDGGGDHFATDWEVTEVVDEAGGALDFLVPEPFVEGVAAWRPDRRLVLVRWPEELPAGADRTVRVGRRQTVPYAAIDSLHTRRVRMGTSTPTLPAIPTVAGDPGTFPFGLHVTAPPGTIVAASGRPRPDTMEGDDVRREGQGGGAAVVVVGPSHPASVPGVRVLTAKRLLERPETLSSLAPRLYAWSERKLAHVDLVQLVASWRFPMRIEVDPDRRVLRRNESVGDPETPEPRSCRAVPG